ncbi:hypothetical protein B0T25DRAFT_239070 [Lasiosphaeria hispida]|uniref:Uncharacterized protein n=1 Tax=Lasiosphaeria hispida TaxID=260671 RepID=A0AAJ0MC73_9PEZI|nr:hypothetical protein B0T25DRAFT_239070 [Lasiosphaeria hispida]
MDEKASCPSWVNHFSEKSCLTRGMSLGWGTAIGGCHLEHIHIALCKCIFILDELRQSDSCPLTPSSLDIVVLDPPGVKHETSTTSQLPPPCPSQDSASPAKCCWLHLACRTFPPRHGPAIYQASLEHGFSSQALHGDSQHSVGCPLLTSRASASSPSFFAILFWCLFLRPPQRT